MAGTNIQPTPGGHAGIETRGIIGFSEGYKKGRLSLERFVDAFSTNPAKLMGLYYCESTMSIGHMPCSAASLSLLAWAGHARRGRGCSRLCCARQEQQSVPPGGRQSAGSLRYRVLGSRSFARKAKFSALLQRCAFFVGKLDEFVMPTT